MERHDIAIIGSGPAGLEAAVTATVRNKNIILFGSKSLSNKMQVVDHPIKNYLGLPEITGKEMAAAFQKQLDILDIEVEIGIRRQSTSPDAKQEVKPENHSDERFEERSGNKPN